MNLPAEIQYFHLASADVLYAAGFRMIGLHHFFDNALGGSLHGESDGGTLWRLDIPAEAPPWPDHIRRESADRGERREPSPT